MSDILTEEELGALMLKAIRSLEFLNTVVVGYAVRTTQMVAVLRRAVDNGEIALQGGIADISLAVLIEELCESRGYGNMMATVSRMWHDKDPIGAFAFGPCFGVLEPWLEDAKSALAAAESAPVPTPEFEDVDVQMVYKILCDTELAPPASEHWEGFTARRIISQLRSTQLAAPVPESAGMVTVTYEAPREIYAIWFRCSGCGDTQIMRSFTFCPGCGCRINRNSGAAQKAEEA